MQREKSSRLSVGFFVALVVGCMWGSESAQAWFTPPLGSNVTKVLDTADNDFNFMNSPSDQAYWTVNNGTQVWARLKGYQEMAGIKFDLSSYRGKEVVTAELHLCKQPGNVDAVTSLVAATINTDWPEYKSCWRYRDATGTPPVDWTFSHSDFATATFGNYGSIVSYGFSNNSTFTTYTYGGNTWLAMKLDPAFVKAMILDQPGGLTVTDARWHSESGGNPQICTNNYGGDTTPRLHILFATSTDTNPPTAVGALSAAAGLDNGSVVLSFTAPSDPEETKAFGYNVWYTSSSDNGNVERWRIPRPKTPGAQQSMLIEGRTPGAAYTFYVQAYDSIGNLGPTASVTFTVPAAVATPVLANGGLATPDPTGKTIRTDSGGKMRYWAVPETTKVNPATGNRMEDVDGSGNPVYNSGTAYDNYKKANMVWDAGTNTISLLGCRNEMVGAQIVLGRTGASLDAISVAVSNLVGPNGSTITASPNVELFQAHYITDTYTGNISFSAKFPDAAIPLTSPLPTTFSIPDTNHNAGGTYQSVYMDLYVPQDVNPGDYSGTVTVSASGMSPVTINLKVHVSSLMIPDYPTFIVDYNGYNNPWDFGSNTSNTCLKYFQVVHKHRAVPNTLPYHHDGSLSSSDRGPAASGLGGAMHAMGWSAFDTKYGRFFTSDPASSGFSAANGYTGPGANTPITHFYTTFNESWPVYMVDSTYGFDAVDGSTWPAYWANLQNAGLTNSSNWLTMFSTMPDIWGAFPNGYRQANVNVVADWLTHAQTNGWTKTAFEVFLNEKFSYSGAHVYWDMEECDAADDFRADGWYHQMWRDGQAASGVTNVPWHFRLDISDRWSLHYGQLDNRVNWWDLGSGAAAWHWPNKKYRKYLLDSDKPEDWIWYGNGANVAATGVANTQVLLQRWSQDFKGGILYWDAFSTNWTSAADPPGVIYSGQSVPGYGLYSGPIMSIRAKQIRQGEQIIELLNMWAATPGMNRNRVRDSLNAKYGAGTWDYSFSTLDEVSLHKLRADLIAQLEPILLPPAAGSPTPVSGATGIQASQTLTWNSSASGLTYDVYVDYVNPPVTKVASGLSNATFTTSQLAAGATYYWQVVSRNGNGTTMGPVWSFATALFLPSAPANPSPSDGRAGVVTSSSLSWTGAGPGTTFDVYFGTANPPTTKVATGQSAASYTPAAMQVATRYYWKVVAFNVSGSTAGTVWTFASRIVGDINGDNYVNVGDLQRLVAAWGSDNSGAWGNWNPMADLNNDGYVNVLDLQLLVANWTATVP